MSKNDGKTKKLGYAIGLLRIGIGLVLSWAFFDKLLGLGYATCRDADSGGVEVLCEKAWVSGGSPTSGFLQFGSSGPFQDLFQSMAGNAAVDWLFMAGLLLIGLSLVVGVGVKVAAVTGSLLMLMMWTALLPTDNHPFIDDHIIYILALGVVLFGNDSQRIGFGRWWSAQPVVKKFSWLE